MAKKRYHHSSNEYYAGEEGRRMQEMRDAGMISEDKSAIANLPQMVKIEAYPSAYDYMPEAIDDSIRGIDEQLRSDDEGKRKNFKPKKF